MDYSSSSINIHLMDIKLIKLILVSDFKSSYIVPENLFVWLGTQALEARIFQDEPALKFWTNLCKWFHDQAA